MKAKGYTNFQIERLNENPNVVMVKYGKQIEYKDIFKKWAVEKSLSHPEMSAIQIFEEAGFDRNVLGTRTAESRIRYWKCKFCRNEKVNQNKVSNIKSELFKNEMDTALLDLVSRVECLIAILGRKK